MDNAKRVLWFFFVLFAALGFVHLSLLKMSALDSFIAAACVLFTLYLSTKYKISTFTAIFFCLIFVPNAIGTINNYSWFNYHYDWIVHSTVPIFAVLSIGRFFLDNKMFSKNAVFVAFLITISFGAFVEMTEWWGFVVLGTGEGWLGFGEGDNSTNYGPWENSSIDTTLNFASSIIGSLIMLIIGKKFKS